MRRATLAAAFVLISIAPSARAQGWPEAAIFGGIGGGVSQGFTGYGADAGITRRWGPVFGSLLGDLVLRADRLRSSGYEWSVTVPGAVAECIESATRRRAQAAYCAEGSHVTSRSAVMAEAGVVLEPTAPMMIGLGYREGSGAGPYGMVGFFWGAEKLPQATWFLRVAAGSQFAQYHFGVALDFR